MKQQVFETQHQTLWRQMEAIVDLPDEKVDDNFPYHYRSLCQHLAVAKSRQYSPQLISYLNHLVVGGHRILYRHHRKLRQQWRWFLVQGFPTVIRDNYRYVCWSLTIFLLPLLMMGIACYLNSELIYSLMDAFQVRQLEAMYNPEASVLGRERNSETDLAMFGFYIYNNIGIGFRTFAGGIVFTLGSIFFLLFNGLSIGGTAGYLTQLGYTDTFYGFVSGHASFELTAIVFCGAAGLKLGFALIDPGSLKRLDAIILAGREAILMVYGAAIMLVIAAFIEAFWSSSQSLPVHVKYTAGTLLTLLLSIYLIFSGRHRGP